MDDTIASSENVARILNPNWIENGELMFEAFKLRKGETYISVNRPAIESYNKDVNDFISSHPEYLFDGGMCKRALLSVESIRNIDVTVEGVEAKINVEVEPRNAHYKSHAGIFTRIRNKNVKGGQLLEATAEEAVSSDTILLEVRMSLVDISIVEDFERIADR